VLPDDRVGARRVDDVDFAEERGGGGNHVKAGFAYLPFDRLAVLQHIDLRRRRRHPFGDHPAAEQGVDERTLACVELPDDDQQEELV
jgi:hypothetical protein